MAAEKQRSTFISYSRVNKDFAVKLAKELRADGYSIWLDQLDIPTGARWDNELEKALEECEIFLLILTPAAITSENVKDEIGYAIDNRKRILPLMLENCDIPLRLRRFQYVDFTMLDYDEGVQKARQQLDVLATEPTIPRNDVQAEEKPSAKETAARIVMRRTASNRYISEQASVIKASGLLMEGKKLAQNGDWFGASQKFRQVLELIPDHGETKSLLANAEAQLQQKQESLRNQLDQTDKPAINRVPDTKSVQEIPVSVGQTPKGVLNKTTYFIILGFIALVGIISAVIGLTGNKSSPVTSIGMVEIPAGSYWAGEDTVVVLDELWIDRYEIRNSDYAKYIDETGNNPPAYWIGGDIPPGLREHPVAQVKWEEANEYCSWVGKRLPTEAEWEVAARDPFGWKYPWGDNPDLVRQETQGTLPVDGNPANRSYFGAYFMSGNVWEWVDAAYTPTAKNEHVMRGGAYGPLDVLTAAIPVPDDSHPNAKMGFRCAASGENVIRQYDDTLSLDDDFDTTNTNWPGIHEDNFLFDYHELGFYHMEARESNKFIPAFYEHETFSNFVLETGVFVDKANTDNQQGNFRYGLGVEVSDSLFYAFLVSAKNQKWQVVQGALNEGSVIGNSSDLVVVASGSESSIRGASQEEEDRLTVIVNGTELMYYVNGNLVYVLTVEDHQKVKVGFVVETLEDVTRVHIHFNWIKLLNIEPFEN